MTSANIQESWMAQQTEQWIYYYHFGCPYRFTGPVVVPATSHNKPKTRSGISVNWSLYIVTVTLPRVSCSKPEGALTAKAKRMFSISFLYFVIEAKSVLH